MAQLSLNCKSTYVSLLIALATFKRDLSRLGESETLTLTKLRESLAIRQKWIE